MSDTDDLEFRINTKFAQNYDKWRRKEELQKLKDRYGEEVDEESSSSSEEEDEDAEGLTAQVEKDFLKMLSYVKSKDPRIYNKDATFYHKQESSSGESSEEDAPLKKKKKQNAKKPKDEKPVYLKDYERNIITEKGGHYSDEEEDEEEEEEFGRAASPTYVQEQEMIKKSFQTALENSDSDESGDDSLLKRRQKTPREKTAEEEEYIQWMKGQKEAVTDRKAAEDAAEMVRQSKKLDALRRYWTDPSLEEGEKFLRDFILNKGYKDKDVDEDDRPMELEEADFSEEERLLDAQDEFERKYNFRYEEPDAEFIKRYPRTMASSVRAKDNKRALKRQDRKERKQQEKEHKKEELKQLKNLKKQEIIAKLEKLRQVTGNTSVGFEDVDLEGDFDPEQHDRLMKKVFDEEYDTLAEEDTKPEFEHEDWEEEDWDNWGGQDYGDEEYYEEDDEGPHYDDPDFNMDADYDPSLSKQANKERKLALQQELIGSSSKKRKKKMSKFAEALYTEKPVFDPNEKTFEMYIEEYYNLDYEDMIGDLPCRFKYRKVVANDFGLTTEEILSAKERELNQWASLKKTCQYRTEEEEERDRRLFAKKAQNEAKKRRVFLSLLEQPSDNEESDDETTAKRKKAPKSTGKTPHSKTKKSQKMSEISKTPGKTELEQFKKKKPKKMGVNSSALKETGGELDEDDDQDRMSEESSSQNDNPTNGKDASSKKIELKKSKETLHPKEPTPKEDKPKSSPKKESQVNNRGFDMSVIKGDIGKGSNIDSAVASEDRTTSARRRKRKRRRSHTEDHSKQQVIGAYANETSATPSLSNSKQNAALDSYPTSATESSINVNRTEKKKQRGEPENHPVNMSSKDKENNTNLKLSPKIETEPETSIESRNSKKQKRKRKTSEQQPEANTRPHQNHSAATPSIQNQKEVAKIKTFLPSSPTATKNRELDFARIKQKLKMKNLNSNAKKLDSESNKFLKHPKGAQNAASKMNSQSSSPVSTSSSKMSGKRKAGDVKQPTSSAAAAAASVDSKPKSNRTRNKNRNRRRAKRDKMSEQGKAGPTVSDARLKAYGINPKKHVYRMKFLKEQEAKRQKQNQVSQRS